MEEWYGRVFTVTDCFFAFLTLIVSVFTYLHVCRDIHIKKWLFSFLRLTEYIRQNKDYLLSLWRISHAIAVNRHNFKANWGVSNWTYDMDVLVNVFLYQMSCVCFWWRSNVYHTELGASIKQSLCFQLSNFFLLHRYQNYWLLCFKYSYFLAK